MKDTSSRRLATSRLDVAGCGSMVVDFIYRVPRIAGAEEKIILQPHLGLHVTEQKMVGGLTLNHLAWARIFGLHVGIFGRIGNDSNGDFLRGAMERFGIEQHLTVEQSESSFARIMVDERGERAIYMSRGATAELGAEEIRRRHGAFIRRARLVSTEISQLPLKTVIAVLEFARTHSIPTVLDFDVALSDACPGLGSERELHRALKLATFLKPAKSAAAELAGGKKEPMEIAQLMRRRYRNAAVIITDGARGCVIAAQGENLKVPAFRIKPVDTTGAGDAFLGALVAGLRRGLGWQQIGRLANAAGAICASQLGAFPGDFEVRGKILKLCGEQENHLAPVAAARRGSVVRFDAAEHAAAPASPADRMHQQEVNRFLDLALAELGRLRTRLDEKDIWRAIAVIRDAEARGGRLHITGVGKPEHVARYGASLLCSVGTPTTFLHATETLHGSLGQVHHHDVVIAISNSGDTAETCAAVQAIKEHGAKVIALVGRNGSPLARMADLVLHAPIQREGGILGLAPRTSVMAQIYVIAAISVALEAVRGLTAEQYSRWHRAGTLGETARTMAAARALKNLRSAR